NDECELVRACNQFENLVPVLHDRRPRILRDLLEIRAVLSEDRINEGVQKQIRMGNPDPAKKVLHLRPRSSDERSVRKRLVLGPFLPDDQNFDLSRSEPAPIKHRSEMPAKLLALKIVDTNLPIIGGGRKKARPWPTRVGTGIVFPRTTAIVPILFPHAGL